MYQHHMESIKNMIDHYQENEEITALFLVGSVATKTARPDSDLDGVAIVSHDYYELKKRAGELEEVHVGKCTYEGGYFNIHYMTKDHLKDLVKSGSEPMRNMFTCAQTLFCDDSDIPELVTQIPVFQLSESQEKQFRFYCTLKMFHTYFWVSCRPEGFMRSHVANGMIYNLYRLILIENKILFPSMRNLEAFVKKAPNKPDHIIEICQRFMDSLSDEDALAVIDSFEAWTTYDYPKDYNVVMNNFSNPYEWQ